MSAGDWVPVRTDAGYHLQLVGANGEVMLSSEVYSSGLDGITEAMRVIQATPPFLAPIKDERAEGGKHIAGDDADA